MKRPGASKRKLSSTSLEVVPSKSESGDFQNYSKRPKEWSPIVISYSNFSMNLDGLPDSILFEILVRLPVKRAIQYRCVSRRWLALISHRTFVARYLFLQHDKRNPMLMEPTLFFLNHKGFSPTTKFKNGSFEFSLDFLPGYQDAHEKRLELDLPLVASCHDIVLWCPSRMLQRDYYICNPYTKQWTALPPPPQCNFGAIVGFICEPYYYYNKDIDHHDKCDKAGDSNVDYKYAIVRILSQNIGFQELSELAVEIFSSENGEWREYVFSCPPNFRVEDLRYEYAGLAYKGKLYWTNEKHYSVVISLDPFSNYVKKKDQDPFLENNNNKFDVVEFLDNERGVLSVSQGGRLRIFATLFYGIHVWELKDDEDKDDNVGGGVGKWCKIVELPLNKMVTNDPLITQRLSSEEHSAWEVACDPSNDDIWYVKSLIDFEDDIILMCVDIRTNTIEKVMIDKYSYRDALSVFRYMVPWWPTPVPEVQYNHKDVHEAHRTKCTYCSDPRCNEALMLNMQKLRLENTIF